MRAGTGLGLAISRGFVEAMRGTIAAANRTDRTGAVFTSRLPVPPRSASAWTPPHERGPAQGSGRRRRAADPQAAAHGLDARRAIEILEAPNGKAALELLARSPGPGHSRSRPARTSQGLELLRTIRARNESVPIVVLSSRGDEAGKVAGARPRRRRLCDQAVRHGRAARADARGAAPSASGPWRAADLPRRRSLGRSRPPHRQGAATRR